MAQFTVNTSRIDPYKNFKFRVRKAMEPSRLRIFEKTSVSNY
jgi:hypothetical protein